MQQMNWVKIVKRFRLSQAQCAVFKSEDDSMIDNFTLTFITLKQYFHYKTEISIQSLNDFFPNPSAPFKIAYI